MKFLPNFLRKKPTLESVPSDSKDENTPQQEFKKGNINKASYKIIIYETISGLPRKVMEFMAVRIVDEEDHIPYLRFENAKTKKVWLEIFPQQVQEFMNYTEKEVDDKISKLKKKIKEEEQKEFSKINIKDLQYDLIKLEAKKRSFKFSSTTSYISLDENNVPEIFYKRQGSSFIPFKWDCDSSTIFLPSDNKKKNSAIALRNKESKYPTRENQVRIATMVVFILACILALGAGFLFYEAGKNYADNELNNIKEQNLKDMQNLNKVFQQQGQTMQQILQNMSGNIIVTGRAESSKDSPTIDLEKK